MKPLYLSIAGLHSFREKQYINFQELSDLGIFGIFGPTGSGKSSVLDAMTLALYGKVVRAKGGRGKQGIINHAEETAHVSFTFALGAGVLQKTYRVDRSYKTKDHLSVNNTHSRLVEIADDTEVVIAENDDPVTRQITQLLGLTPDDFTKAVVLPQGSFSEFLRLSGSDRRRMLERLFCLEQYGQRLAENINNRYAALNEDVKVLAAEQKGLGDASQAALRKAKSAYDDALIAERAANAQWEGVQREHERLEGIVNLQQELAGKETELAAHQIRQAGVEEMAAAILLAEKAANILPFSTDYDTACKKYRETAAACLAAENRLTALQKAMELSEARYQAAQKTRASEEPKLVAAVTRLELARQIEQETAELAKSVRAIEQEAARHETEKIDLGAKLATLEKRLAEVSAGIAKLESELKVNTVTAGYRTQLRQASEKAAAFEQELKFATQAGALYAERQKAVHLARQDFTLLQATLKDNKQQLINLTDAEQASAICPYEEDQLTASEIRLAEQNGAVERIAALEAECKENEQVAGQLQKSVTDLKQQNTIAQQERQAADEAVERAANAWNDWLFNDRKAMAAKLAGHLEPGKPCPVCGAVEHPAVAMPAEDLANSRDRERLETELSQAKKRQILALENARKCEGEYVTAITRLEAASEACRRTEAELARLVSLLAAELGATPVSSPVSPCLRHILSERIAENRQAKTALKAWQAKRGSLAEALGELRQKDAKAEAAAAGLRQKLQSAEEELAKIAAQAAELELRVNSSADVLRDVLLRLGCRLESVQTDGVKQVRHLETVLARMDHMTEKLQQEIEKLRQVYTGCQIEQTQLRQQYNAADVLLSGLQAKYAAQHAAWTERKTQLNAMTQGKPVALLLTQARTTLDSILETEKAALEAAERVKAELESAGRLLAQAQISVEHAGKSEEQAKERLSRQLAENGFQNAAAVKAAVLQPELMRQKQAAVEEYRRRLTQIMVERNQIAAKLGTHSVSDTEWLTIEKQLQNAARTKEMTTTVRIEAEKECRDLENKRERWSELAEKLAAANSQLEYVTELKNLVRGNMFVEFLAQEQMNIVLEYASERLKQLSRNRYALEIDSEGTFFIRDDMNGGVRRPASTLSGGETFQASLALALALSTHIQLRGRYPLEFFFLDEGFGSLDQDSLDTVMSALERLHIDRLTIGIISHVGELQQRMLRRLLVEPAEPAGSGSRVRVERA